MSNTILEARQLTKDYLIGEKSISVLRDVSLSISQGEFVVITGSSGSGKTTLLSLLSGLDIPTSGEVVLQGRSLQGLSEDDLAPIRNAMTGFVFQAYHLIPSLSAVENVMFPAELRKDRNALDKAEALLKKVGLWERRDNLPSQLSGGEKQRVAICRALINDPLVVFADEPTGNLDSKNSDQVMDILKELHRESNTTLVLATHSKSLAQLAERTLTMHDGMVVSASGI